MKHAIRVGLALVVGGGAGCVVDEEPVPDDVYEDGWDQVSPETRVRVLREDLHRTLEELENSVGSERDALLRLGGRQLSALRPELLAREHGEAEYRELERRFETLSGDAP